jgi:MFS family permease
MVPLFSFLVAGRLIARFGAGPVVAAGAALFAGGVAWWALAAGTTPDYVGDMLGGMLLTGVGVGLTLPTLMATAASSLPPPSFATGSAVVNMLRQVGLAIGVAALVAVLGTPASPLAAVSAFQSGWALTAATMAAAGLVGLPGDGPRSGHLVDHLVDARHVLVGDERRHPVDPGRLVGVGLLAPGAVLVLAHVEQAE